MIKRVLTILFTILLSVTLFGQELHNLFKAESFTEAYFNPVYQELKQRKAKDVLLTEKEEKWLNAYQKYLDDYFVMLNDKQQNIFYQKRAAFDFRKMDTSNVAVNIQPTLQDRKGNVKGERDNELLFGHILFSGASGIVYGLQLNYILDIERGATRIGLPMLISGGSMLLPVFMPQYENINSNSLWLRIHGKAMGGLYGYFLAGTMFGDDIFESYNDHYTSYEDEFNRNKKPFALTTSLLGSITMGQLGLHLGKTKPWTDGRVATYQYYSYATPAVACGLLFAIAENSEFQAYSALITAGVPLGYLAGHQVANKLELTRGDINAITNNTAIGALFGLSALIYTDPESPKAILIPLGTAITGSAIGHYTFRNFHITRPEARRLNYATLGGGLIGLGISIMAEPENEGAYLLVPSIFGAIGYASLLGYYKKQPRFTYKNDSKNNFNFSFHPESLLLNKELPANMKAPLFSMRWTL